MLNLYKLSQSVNNNYDTYDSAIVAAETPEQAILVHPSKGSLELEYIDNTWQMKNYLGNWIDYGTHTWAHPTQVIVELVGTAHPSIQPNTVLCASFNAG